MSLQIMSPLISGKQTQIYGAPNFWSPPYVDAEHPGDDVAASSTIKALGPRWALSLAILQLAAPGRMPAVLEEKLRLCRKESFIF